MKLSRFGFLISAGVSSALVCSFAIAQTAPEEDPLADLFEQRPTQSEVDPRSQAAPESQPPDTVIPDDQFEDEDSVQDEADNPQGRRSSLAPIFAPDFDPEAMGYPELEEDGSGFPAPDYGVPTENDPDGDEELEDGFGSEEAEAADAEDEGELQTLEYQQQPAVLLRGLDKISGRSTDLEVAVDSDILFGGLRITVKACHETPPTEPPESVAYVEVEDFGFAMENVSELPDEIDMENRVFNGWMFASSPGLNALEHPIYDVWVIRCMTEAPVSASGESDL